MSAPSHRGLATDDPRNAGVIELFRPEDLSVEELRRRIEAIAERVDNPKTKADILDRAKRVGEQTFRPPPQLFQAPGEFAWKDLAWAAHPDLVQAIRRIDAELDTDCLCLLWGRPALVHPGSGVVFAVAIGSIGIAARLPAAYASAPVLAAFDLAPAGPDWRFADLRDTAWGQAALSWAG